MKRHVSYQSQSAPPVKHPKPKELNQFGENRNIRHMPEIQQMKVLKTKTDDIYEIKSVLGEGMFGIVFEVMSPKCDHLAAKVLKHTNEPPECWKIEEDILRAMSKDPHENLLSMLYADELESPPIHCTPNVIFTKVLGASLLDVLTDVQTKVGFHGCTFPINSIKRVGNQMLQALLHLEKLKIHHLDVKPENVYFYDTNYTLAENDFGAMSIEMFDTGIQIGDFGCSRFHEADTTPCMVQTQNYRAPEIFMGLPHSNKTDVWSLGAVLAEMYTGQLLFYGTDDDNSEATQFEMMQRVLSIGPSRRMWMEAVQLKSDKVVLRRLRPQMKVKCHRAEPTQQLHSNLRRGDVDAIPLFQLLDFIFEFDPIDRPGFQAVEMHPFFGTF